MRGLRAAQTVYAYITHFDCLCAEKPAGILQIQEVLRAQKDAWDAAVETWKSAVVEEGGAWESLASLTFRCSCFRNGRHEFSSTDVAGGLGKVVLEWQRWTVNLLEFDVEVVAFILQSSVTLALSLNASRTKRRNVRLPKPIAGVQGAPQEFSEGMTAVLRPSTAFLLTRFAKVKPGDVVCDCMAGMYAFHGLYPTYSLMRRGHVGVGSIPLAAVLDDHSVVALGGDIEGVNAQHAELNARRSLGSNSGVVESLQWLVTHL